MLNRFVAALLVISLTACSSVPRSMLPDSTAGIQTATAAKAQAGSDAAGSPDADATPERRPAGLPNVIAVALLAVLVVIGLAAFSRAVSRDFARSCCKAQ